MLVLIIITSLKILFVYQAMQEGNVLHWLYRGIHKVIGLLPTDVYMWVRKPLADCYLCMASVYGILFTLPYFSFTWHYLTTLFAICGMNYLIGSIMGFIHWLMEETEQ